MAKTSADFFYLAANVANSDRPEYAQHFRDAGHALAEMEKEIKRLRREYDDIRDQAFGHEVD